MEIVNFEYKSIEHNFEDTLSKLIAKNICEEKMNTYDASNNALYYATIIAVQELSQYFDIQYRIIEEHQSVLKNEFNYSSNAKPEFENVRINRLEVVYVNHSVHSEFSFRLRDNASHLFCFLEHVLSTCVDRGDLYLEDVLTSHYKPLKNLNCEDLMEEVEIYS